MNDKNDPSHANKGPKVIAIIIIFPFLALVSVILRLFTRIKIIHNQAIDDWIAGVALLFSIVTSVFFASQVQNGMGRHYKYLTEEQGVNFYKTLYLSIISYNVGLLFIKLSILLQYLRVATNKRVILAIHLVMVFTIVYGTEAFFTGVFHCWPISRFWGETNAGKCINKPVLWFMNAGLNITNDMLLLVLPIFILQASTLPRKQKVRICLILSLGGFAALISIWRLYSLFIVSISNDISWDIAEMAIWSCIELNVGITCACVSTLRPLTSKFIPFIFRIWPSSSIERHTSVRGARGSETELGPSMYESQKIGMENQLDANKNWQGTFDGDFVSREKQNGCTGFNSEITQNRNGLVFSQLPNYPALVVVGTAL